jgi:hypothetical protein
VPRTGVFSAKWKLLPPDRCTESGWRRERRSWSIVQNAPHFGDGGGARREGRGGCCFNERDDNLESSLCKLKSNIAECEAMNRAPVRRQV